MLITRRSNPAAVQQLVEGVPVLPADSEIAARATVVVRGTRSVIECPERCVTVPLWGSLSNVCSHAHE